MAKMQATVPAAQNDLVNTIEGNRAGLATGRELNGAVRRGHPHKFIGEAPSMHVQWTNLPVRE